MSAPWRLRVERGPNSGQSYPIDRASATIGRQENNAIVLDDARLSRQHARIETGPMGLIVTDLNSANGTMVNGRPVTGSVPLNPGDRLQLGDTVMVLEGGPPAPLGGPSAPIGDPNATMFAGGPGGGAAGGGFATPGAPAAETPRLVLQGTGTIYRLDRPSMVIGRQPENELPLDDGQASRQHARFETRDGQVTITDLNSANGTRVNGTRINAPTVLNNGDMVQIGTSQLRVEGIAFVDHGTAIALGFFPPPPSGAALGDAAPLGGPPPGGPPPMGGGAFDGPLIEGATVMGGPPPMGGAPPLGAPPPMGGPQPMGGPPITGGPPPGAPGQPWNAPLAPQFGGAAPPIQPPMPPSAPARRRSGPSPILLIGGGAILLLICIGVGVGAFALSRRDNNDPTATAVRAAAGTPTSASAAASNTPLPVAGNSGGNSAPPAPGATPVASSAGTPTGSARPAATPSTAAQPSTAAGQQRIEVAEVGLVFNLPSDWKQVSKDNRSVQFASGDNRAQIVVRFAASAPSSVTAQSIILDELDNTAATDPKFDPSAVRTGTAQISGMQGFGSDPYTFTAQDGKVVTEADRAVVVTGKAQYFFGFLALQTAFDSYGPTFDQIIATIKITVP